MVGKWEGASTNSYFRPDIPFSFSPKASILFLERIIFHQAFMHQVPTLEAISKTARNDSYALNEPVRETEHNLLQNNPKAEFSSLGR